MGSLKLLECNRYDYLKNNWNYEFLYWTEFNFKILENTIVRKYNNYNSSSVNDVTITLDTETSKKHEDYYKTIYHKNKENEIKYIPDNNHIVIWMMTFRLFNIDIATIYGRRPSELIQAINRVREVLKGDYIHIYTHFLGYDWTFIRQFLFKAYGYPIEQLNTKPHYPISIKFENGLVFKDSLILAQRGLEKWAEDMEAPAKKAVGDWNYNLIRHQNTKLTSDELHYCEFDTLSQAQCIDILRMQLHKHIGNVPYTSTGILREYVKKVGAENQAKKLYRKLLVDYDTYTTLVTMFHGGYTHGNRHYLASNYIFGLIQGYDFASSYPFIEMCFKFPMTPFKPLNKPVDLDYILRNSEDHAFIFRMTLVNVKLKDDMYPMPVLQYSKCYSRNDVTDNGRILAAQVVTFYTNEVDASLIRKYYTWDERQSVISEVQTAKKGLLPKWYRDIVYELFIDKTRLKGHDNVLYNIQKFKINATFGNLVQRNDKLMYLEVYETGEYNIDDSITQEQAYEKYTKRRASILPYQWGVWVTSYALKNLFELGSCCKVWLYSDTDSVYGIGWNKRKVKEYNKKCKDLVKAAGYSGVEHEGKIYWPGVAESERKDKYTEFKYMGAKRYCGRSLKDGKLYMTVSGVAKKAVSVLNDDIRNFCKGCVFPGDVSEKKTHSYMYVNDIYIDEFGNETGDSIDLSPCDYKLDQTEYHSIEEFFEATEEIKIECADGVY